MSTVVEGTTWRQTRSAGEKGRASVNVKNAVAALCSQRLIGLARSVKTAIGKIIIIHFYCLKKLYKG